MGQITEPNSIIEETKKLIADARESMLLLNNDCLRFIATYDEYNRGYLYDSKILKDRMKETVLKAASDDEL